MAGVMESENQQVRLQTVSEHLGDLRKVLLWSVLALLISFLGCFHFAAEIVFFLKEPILKLLPENQKQLYDFGLTDQFYSYLKVRLVAALVMSAPVLLLQLWIFIEPALKPQEKKLAFPFVLGSLIAFGLGLWIAYRWILPYLFGFFLSFGEAQSEVPLLGLSEYLSFTLQLLLGTALVFEFPVVLSVLGKLRIINGAILKHFRAQAYIGLAILAAIATPTPDAFTMILAWLPLIVLYELSVLAVSVLSSHQEP